MTISIEVDVAIIGSGIAGLTSALKLAEKNLSVLVISREANPVISNTFYAQGGIIFAGVNDSSLAEDIQLASANTSSTLAIETLLKNGESVLEDILIKKAKTPFARDSVSGNLLKTKEAAHSRARILYQGDFTGKSIEESLFQYVNNKFHCPRLNFLNQHTVIDLITPLHHGKNISERYGDNGVVGVYVYSESEDVVKKVLCKNLIIASGGAGAIYLHHTNSDGARGDGIAMAKRAGAVVINMEFMQFHPTTFYDHSNGRRFLISEALRGEGAKLINSRGEAFMHKYHPQADLAPRDVVTRAIFREVLDTKHHCVYLELEKEEKKHVMDRFPTIFQYCLNKGIDLRERSIPVIPAAHYTCGGIKVDEWGRTSIPNLYAIGEASCTGLHGANRLASTSLIEGLVWGHLSAEDILKNISNKKIYPAEKIRDWVVGDVAVDKALIDQDYLTLKQTMWNYVGPFRSMNRLKRAQAMLSELSFEIQKFYRHSQLSDQLIGLRNAVEVGLMMVGSSTRSGKSIGCFFIDDQ